MSQNATAESVELTRLSAYPSIYPLSSPVSRALIISELLRTIFLFCVADDGEGPRYTDPRPWSSKHSRRRYPLISKMEAPLLLAHICRSWRRTALDTSQLWACFHIHLPEYVLTRPSTAPCSSLVDRRLTALKFWLTMSRKCPISIYFTVGWRPEYGSAAWRDREHVFRTLPSENTVVAKFVQEVMKHLDRWENVILSVPKDDLPPLYDRSKRNLPLLKYLELDRFYANDNDRIGRRYPSLHSRSRLEGFSVCGGSYERFVLDPGRLAPTLRYMEFAGMGMRFTSRVYGHRLRELVLLDVQVNDTTFVRLPLVFPLLEELTLKQCTCYGAEEQDNDIDLIANPVVLDKLSSLRLSLPFMDYWFPLPCMVAPALRHLVIEGGNLWKDADRAVEAAQVFRGFERAITLFLYRCRAPIESFSYRPALEISNIKAMLFAMPDLVKLRYEGVVLSSASLKALSDPALCPCLVSIYNEGQLRTPDRIISHYRPNAEEFSKLIGGRCQNRRNGKLGTNGRMFVRELSFPIHETHEILLRATREFKEADVLWTNTHICSITCPAFD